MTISFGQVSDDYAQYRDGLPEVFFQQLLAAGVDLEGVDVVDLGSGTGILSRALARRGSNVIGIEPTRGLIEQAVRHDQDERLAIPYVEDTAEHFRLQRTFPLFTALRAWHWFDRELALRNIRSHMDANGRLVIMHAAFLPDSEAAQLTFKVLGEQGVELKPAGSLADTKERRNGMPVPWFEEWKQHGFQVAAEWQHDYSLVYSHEAWCGKMRSVSWLAAIDPERRAMISDELLKALGVLEPELVVPHRYSVVVLEVE